MVNTGGGVCPRATFNSLALAPDQCVPCYCFDHTDQCKSADMFINVLPPPAGTYTLRSVSLPSYSSPTPGTTVTQSYLSSTRTGQKLFVPSLSQLEITGVLYFALPQSHADNLLRSYGGHIRFNLRYPGSDDNSGGARAPLIILLVTKKSYISKH